MIILILTGCTSSTDQPESVESLKQENTINVVSTDNESVTNNSILLPIPPILEDMNPDPKVAEYTLTAGYGLSEIMQGIKTNTMGYNGSILGPTIHSRNGEKIIIHIKNELKESTTVHWHGLIVPGEMDGGPHQIIREGETWSPDFTLEQPALTAWYHPHLMGETATQVYQGLGGLWIHDDDISTSLGLPQQYGVDDIPVIIQDRAFYKDGSLYYNPNMMDGAVGNVIMINGVLEPYKSVPSSWVRLRLLNGSNSVQHMISFSDGRFFYQIASDGGLMESPYEISSINLAPGERAEILVDFRDLDKGDAVSLIVSNLKSLELIGDGSSSNDYILSEHLVDIDKWNADDIINERKFDLEGMAHMVSINGERFDMNSVSFTLPTGVLEKWVVSNVSGSSGGMGMMGGGAEHSFHVHGLQFQVLSRNDLPPLEGEQGWKDTVFLKQGETVEILVKFTLEGVFMYHCHNLEHEDAGMMGQFRVIN